MKNKGFTLVELLAVIAILAILVIIALPNVLKMFNESKEKIFLTESKLVFKEAINQTIKDRNYTDAVYCKSMNDEVNPLDMSGRDIYYYIKANVNDNTGTIIVWDNERYAKYKGDKLDPSVLDNAEKITDDIRNATCDNIAEAVGLVDKISDTYKVTGSAEYSNLKMSVSIKVNMENMNDSTIDKVKYFISKKLKDETEFTEIDTYVATNKSEKFEYSFEDNTNVMKSGTKYKVIAYTEDGREIDESIFNYDYCFVAGTKVKTENGFKNIEDIKVGEIIYSYNLDNNNLELKKVLDTIKSSTIDTYKVTIGDKEVEMSPKHQIYIIDKGWVRAYNLKVGDKLLDINGKEVSITKIEYKKYDKPIDTYNLTVEGNGNYFVTNIQVLVHNSGSPST